MNIFLVEDDERAIRALTAAFEKEGAFVVVARDGAEALKKFKKTFDLILLDILLPIRNGFDVLRVLREEKKAVMPILILSNLSKDTDIAQALKLGATGYMIKSTLSIKNIVHRVKQVLERSGAKREAQSRRRTVSSMRKKSGIIKQNHER